VHKATKHALGGFRRSIYGKAGVGRALHQEVVHREVRGAEVRENWRCGGRYRALTASVGGMVWAVVAGTISIRGGCD